MRAHANEYGVDPERLAAIGGSAGGQKEFHLSFFNPDGTGRAENRDAAPVAGGEVIERPIEEPVLSELLVSALRRWLLKSWR